MYTAIRFMRIKWHDIYARQRPIHTARKVKKRLEDHDMKMTDWPLYPPDLTVTEHMWFKLKEVIYQMCSDIEEMDGSKKRIKDALFDALEKAWPLTDEKSIDGSIRSMERRVQIVVAGEK